MTTVVGLMRGYVFRLTREAVVGSMPVLLVVCLWLVVPATSPGAFGADLLRTVLACAPFVGPFFRGLEVVGQPVSRRQVWIAQWLLATLGVTTVFLVGRIAARVLHGSPDAAGLVASTVVDLFACVVCAGFTAAILHPRRPLMTGTRVDGLIVLAVLGVVWPGAPIWSAYAGTITAAGPTTPGALAFVMVTAGLFVVGLRAAPDSFAGLRRGTLQWTDVQPRRRTSSRAGDSEASARHGEAFRWARRKLTWAAVWGVGACLFSAAIAAFDPDPLVASLTFVQHLAGPYVGGGDLSRVMTAAVAATWPTTIAADLRFLRSLPLSRYLIAATLTAGVASTILTSAVIEVLAYRFGFGLWPESLHLPTIVATICVVALAKTGILAIGRTWLFVFPAIAVSVMTWFQLALGQLSSFGTLPMFVSAFLVLALSMRLDIALLDGASRLYRVTQAST